MSAPILRVRDLNVRFSTGGGALPVVRDFSLDLGEGEFVGLVGESGCGKTVTALALMGLLPAHQAEVRARELMLGDQRIDPPASGLRAAQGDTAAMIFQEPRTALDPVFSIGWQLGKVIRRRHGVGRKAARVLAREALAASGFPDPDEVLPSYPWALSGGMRQLVMIAMAIAVRPRVLIADEPTTALDVTSQRLVLDRLLQLQREHGVAVLLITHDLGVVAHCCSRIMVMYCGRVIEEAPYPAFHAQPRHPYSAGLLAAAPRVGGKTPPVAIPGQVPPYADLPGGCSFHPRCARADSACIAERPPLADSDRRRVACHHPL